MADNTTGSTDGTTSSTGDTNASTTSVAGLTNGLKAIQKSGADLKISSEVQKMYLDKFDDVYRKVHDQRKRMDGMGLTRSPGKQKSAGEMLTALNDDVKHVRAVVDGHLTYIDELTKT